jgi:hypothetical protein
MIAIAALTMLIVVGLYEGFRLALPEVLGQVCQVVDPIGSTNAGDCLQ